MTLLSSFLAATNYKNPFLRTLVPSIGLAYGLQAAVAVPSIVAQSERFYDLSGSLTYISCAALSLYLPALRARSAARLTGAPLPSWPSLIDALQGKGPGPSGLGLNWRQVVLSAAVSVWASRRKTCQNLPRPSTANTSHSGKLPLPAHHGRRLRLTLQEHP